MLSIFLGEAAGIGFLGGLGGILISWGWAGILNVLVLSYMAGQAVENGGLPPTAASSRPYGCPPCRRWSSPHTDGAGLGLYPALKVATLARDDGAQYE